MQGAANTIKLGEYLMKLKENTELKMINKFRKYIDLTKEPCINVCKESGITAPTFRKIVKNEEFIPQKDVRDKIITFMNNKLVALKELIED